MKFHIIQIITHQNPLENSHEDSHNNYILKDPKSMSNQSRDNKRESHYYNRIRGISA